MLTPIEKNGETVGFVDSRIGGRKENQDSAGLKETPLGLLVVVCDGMGGMQGGSVASQLAVRTILETVSSADKKDNPVMTLKKAIRSANIAVIEKGADVPELQGMGTTVTALLVTPQSAITAYVGDSRIYQLRNGKKIFRTFDHSMVFEMVRKKVITEEQARLSAQSNVILRALGISPDVEITVEERPYLKGDRFILCTDGFWGAMPENEFLRHLSEATTIDKILESTANVVESIGRNGGGEYDNLTAAIVEMNTNSIMKDKMNKISKISIAVLSLLLLVSLTFNVILLLPKEKKQKVENVNLPKGEGTTRAPAAQEDANGGSRESVEVQKGDEQK